MNISDTIPVFEQVSYPEPLVYDSDVFFHRNGDDQAKFFPNNMIEQNRNTGQRTIKELNSYLKTGEMTESRIFQHDWTLFVVLFSAFGYVVIRTFFGKFYHNVFKYALSVRSVDAKSDALAYSRRNPILLYSVSFLNIALFAYCVAEYYGFGVTYFKGILFLLLNFCILVAGVLSRHILCLVVGRISGKTRLFHDYMGSIYYFYVFLSIVLYFITILILYTDLVPINILIIMGFSFVILVFALRYIRLFFSFLGSNISILYLILYLCALEILPVAVIIKYIQGVF